MSICMVQNCEQKSRAQGYCSLHYQRKRRNGDALAPLKVAPRLNGEICSAPDCGRLSAKRSLCLKHYHRLRRKGVFETGRPDRLASFSQVTCSVDGCDKNAMALHLCQNHYAKLKKHGSPTGGYIQDGRSKEWHIRKGGYVIKFDRENPHGNPITGIVMQHRQVIGEAIGRPLDKTENVHHKNGDRADNRLENLELWVKSQPAGQRVSDQVKWAREILEKYGSIGILDVL
jgi:hypothetical protein